MKTINKVLNILRDYMATKGSVYGIEALGVFGSVARDQEREDSDVDVVIKLGKSNLMTLSRIRWELEEAVNRHVQIVQYRERMNPFLKKRIDREAQYV